MEAHEIRIAQIEKRQDRLDDALERLADDMHKLAMATAQQAEDRAAIKRAFAELESTRKDVAEMKESLRAAEERRLTSVISEQAKEIDDVRTRKRALAWELSRLAIVAVGAAVLAHFGVKVFG